MSKTFSILFLAGGKGSRVGGSIPKQFVECHGQPIAFYSLTSLLSVEPIECVVVCEESYRPLFMPLNTSLTFAPPGKERMLSVYEGMKALTQAVDFLLVHDAARPFVKREDILQLLDARNHYEAAALATPVSSTIKKTDPHLRVTETLPRECLWEMQTPQLISYPLLSRGLHDLIKKNQLVTDEMAVAEAVGYAAKLIPGDPLNFKITTSKDLALAELMLSHTQVML